MTKNDQNHQKSTNFEKNLKNRKKTRTLKVSRIYGDLSLKYGAFFSCFFDLFFFIFHDFSCFFDIFHVFSSFLTFRPIHKNDPPMYVCMYIYIYIPPQFLQEGLNSDDEIIGSINYFIFILLFLYLFLFYYFYILYFYFYDVIISNA